LLAALLSLGCTAGDGAADDTSDPSPPASDESPTPSDTAPRDTTGARTDEPQLAFGANDGTAGLTLQRREGMEPAILAEVRSASHEEFDRVVFEFRGRRVPGYRIEYVDRPVRQCGSGEPVEVAGDGWLQVRLEPARAHAGDTAVVATVTERNRELDLPNLRQLVLTCDFEAQVEWVLGLGSPNPYRIIELPDPPRLVVDVRH
jgi:hypothetical protein